MRGTTLSASLAILIHLGMHTTPAEGQCAAGNGIATPPGTASISVTGDLGSDRTTAVAKWENGCTGSGASYPDLQVGGTSNITFEVISHQGARTGSQPGNGCEYARVMMIGGELIGAEINIWTARRDGSPCNASPSDLIAHGMGHALGLLDVIGTCNANMTSCSCDGTIMGRPLPGQTSNIGSDVCSEIRSNWETELEQDPPRPNPNPCFVGAVPQTSTLTIEGAESVRFAAASKPPARVEKVDGITYLMEDWAILGFGRGGPNNAGGVQVHQSSSPGFGDTAGRRLARGGNRGMEGTVLVVDSAVHPSNARSIPLPEVQFPPTPIPFLGEPARVVARIDLGEDRAIREIQLIHSTTELPAGLDLRHTLREMLEVRYGSHGHHRVILFAVMTLRNGAVEMAEHRVVLPLCCCNPICI